MLLFSLVVAGLLALSVPLMSRRIAQRSHKTSRDSMRLDQMKLTLLFAATIALAGCATSSTGPLSAGPDTFVVSRQAGAFPSGREPLLAEALAEANSKCASLGKSMKLISTTENPGPYILGNYPKVTAVFSCT